jgi:hypothetical protein
VSLKKYKSLGKKAVEVTVNSKKGVSGSYKNSALAFFTDSGWTLR